MKLSKFFKNKKVNLQKLLDFGFEKENNYFVIQKSLLNKQFELYVFVYEDGRLKTKLIEVDTSEEYSLHLVEGVTGDFVGQIKTEFNNFLEEIDENCCEPDVFKNPVTLELIDYIREKYGDELEFLWEKFAGNAVVRRKDNSKWYAIFLTIPKSKLGFKSFEPIEIIDLRAENVEDIVDNELIFPGYHMNKKHWITMILDDFAPIKNIQEKIDKSYNLAEKNKKVSRKKKVKCNE